MVSKFAFFSSQHWWRSVLERQRFTRLRSAVIVLQRAVRRKQKTKHKRATKVQALIRGIMARKHLRKLQECALRIQVRNRLGVNIVETLRPLFWYMANIFNAVLNNILRNRTTLFKYMFRQKLLSSSV